MSYPCLYNDVFIGYIGTDSIGPPIKRLQVKKPSEDGEINNQRKAFLDMLAWSEGIDNGRQKTRNHGYDVIAGESFTDYSDHPRKLVTLNLKLKSAAPDATSFFPVGGMPTASSLA